MDTPVNGVILICLAMLGTCSAAAAPLTVESAREIAPSVLSGAPANTLLKQFPCDMATVSLPFKRCCRLCHDRAPPRVDQGPTPSGLTDP